MTFSNPFTGTVLVAEQDFFYWPGMSGERYAPTFTSSGGGSIGYGSFGAYPSVAGSTSPTSQNSASWPAMGLLKPAAAAFGGFTLSGRFVFVSANTAAPVVELYTQVDAGGIARAGFQFRATVPGSFEVALLGAGASAILSGFTGNVWYPWSITVSAAGAVTGAFAGQAFGAVPAITPTLVIAPLLRLTASSSQAIAAQVTQLNLAYG